ncbi:MAG: hypothetical protein P8189_29055 [Anaerolineae bacterium]
MTGRGEGYCILELPESGRPLRGYAGLEGAPVRLKGPSAWPARWLRRADWPRSIWGRGRGRAAGRGRGRWLARW